MKRILALLLAAVLLVTGCGQAEENEDAVRIYYIGENGKELASYEYLPETEEMGDWLVEITDIINKGTGVPETAVSLADKKVQVLSVTYDSRTLTVDVNSVYDNLSTSDALLIRALLTKTYTQNSDIGSVKMTCGGESIKDADGDEIGKMTPAMFVDDANDDISNYREVTMTLYFADSEGSTLVPEERDVYYSINTPLEQAVVNELLKGPQENGHTALFSSDVNVLNVTISDDICYVNFDESIQNSLSGAEPELQIYSVVHSINAVCGVGKVSFSVNGSNEVMLKDKLSLDQIFTPDGMPLTED